MRMTHHLKTWPEHFEPVHSGVKSFEFRADDRGFEVGDLLELEEWDPETEAYTGRDVTALVVFIMRECPGLPAGYCVMGISPFKDA